MKRPIYILIFSLFISNLSAQTWTKLNLPKTDQNFTDIKVGQDGNLYLLTSMGLFKSTDDGDNWLVYDAGCRNSDFELGDELMTITKDGLVFIDKALTINQTDGSNLKRTEYYTLGSYQRSAQMVSLSTGEIIMAYRDNWGPNDVEYKISNDNGISFTDKKASAAFALKNYKHPIMFVNANDDIYYVGSDYSLYRSTDKGETYTSSGTPYDWDEKLSTLDQSTGTFYVVKKEGLNWKLNKSTDHGANWTNIPLASNHTISSIVAQNNKIIVSSSIYVSYSEDGGATWTDKSSLFESGSFPEKYIFTKTGKVLAMNVGMYGVAEVDFGTGSITAKTDGIDIGSTYTHYYNGTRLAASFSGQAHYSDDNGVTWTRLKGEGAHCGGIYVASSGKIYTAATKHGTWSKVHVQDANDSMVEVSADVGTVWNMSGTNAMYEDESGNVYCVSNTFGVYKSTDGINFTRQSETPFNDGLSDQTVWLDKGSKRLFGYIGTSDVYYSDDYGATWNQVTMVTDMGYPQFHHFKGGSKLWTYMWTTSVAQHGVYSTSGTGAWYGPIGSTLNYDGRYDQLIKGADEPSMYRASTKGFVEVSRDTGVTWSEFESGLDSFNILDRNAATSNFVPVVRFTTSGGKLILATSGSLYMADNGGSSSTVRQSKRININVYPNPVNDILRIESNGPINSVKVISLNGKVVLESNFNPSNTLDVSEISDGVYVLQAQSEFGVSNSKIYIQH